MTDMSMRASDVDRQRTVEVMQEQTAAGRLTLDEFSDRLARAFTATTRGELDALVADLLAAPHGGDGGRSGAAEPVVPPIAGAAAATWVVAAPLVCVLTVLIVIGLLAGSPAALAVVALAGVAVWRWLAAVGRRPGPSAAGGRAGAPPRADDWWATPVSATGGATMTAVARGDSR